MEGGSGAVNGVEVESDSEELCQPADVTTNNGSAAATAAARKNINKKSLKTVNNNDISYNTSLMKQKKANGEVREEREEEGEGEEMEERMEVEEPLKKGGKKRKFCYIKKATYTL